MIDLFSVKRNGILIEVETLVELTGEKFAQNIADLYRRSVGEPGIIAKEFDGYAGVKWGISDYQGKEPLFGLLDATPGIKKSRYLIERIYAGLDNADMLFESLNTYSISSI